MRSALVFFFIASLLVSLGACLPTGGKDGLGKGPQSNKPPIVAEPGLTPKERNIKAIGLLERGKEEEARVELEASLAEVPADKNALAQNLISQIDGDPVAMLGKKNFTHTVAKGESLSAIAEKYLKDKFKFYVLARYNGMNNPSLLKAGEVIKVPGKEPAAVAENTPGAGSQTVEGRSPAEGSESQATGGSSSAEGSESQTAGDSSSTKGSESQIAGGSSSAEGGESQIAEGSSSTEGGEPASAQPAGENQNPPPIDETEQITNLLATADEMAKAGNFPGAIKTIEDGLTQFPQDKMIKDFGAGIYAKFGESLIAQHKYKDGASAVQRAAALDPSNKDIAERVANAKKAVRADDLYQDGQRYEKADANIEAYGSYQAALKVWPEHDTALIALAKIRPAAADGVYRAAKAEFQRQCLNAALELYDRTLVIYPEHGPAKLDRQRTTELLERLGGKSSC